MAPRIGTGPTCRYSLHAMTIVVSLPSQQLTDDVAARLDPALDTTLVTWDGTGEPPCDHIDMYVPQAVGPRHLLPDLAALGCHFVQGGAIGYDGVKETLPPGVAYANASSVHETATAELTVALLLAAQRRLDEFMAFQRHGEWHVLDSPGLADRRIVMLGYGGVGKAIARRLDGFEVELVPVAHSAREQDGLQIHGIDELPDLLPRADILINALPGGEETYHLIDDTVLAALPEGALLVNIGRGPTVDTDALVDHMRRGRIRVASDVWDPEPLPRDHPLWSMSDAIITPHIGGNSSALEPRMVRLIARQAERLVRGQEPVNIVLRS